MRGRQPQEFLTRITCFDLVDRLRTSVGVEPPCLPRKRRVSRRVDEHGETSHFSESVEEYYRLQYFEAIDLAVMSIQDRFNQPGYTMYRNLEDILIKGAAGDDFEMELKEVAKLYKEIEPSKLKVQLANLQSYFAENKIPVSLEECLIYLRSLSPAMQTFYSKICTVACIIVVMPATNAVSERSFFIMRRIKSYVRSTMGQSCLNHLMVLNIHKKHLDSLDLKAIGNEFVSGSEQRLIFWKVFVACSNCTIILFIS